MFKSKLDKDISRQDRISVAYEGGYYYVVFRETWKEWAPLPGDQRRFVSLTAAMGAARKAQKKRLERLTAQH